MVPQLTLWVNEGSGIPSLEVSNEQLGIEESLIDHSQLLGTAFGSYPFFFLLTAIDKLRPVTRHLKEDDEAGHSSRCRALQSAAVELGRFMLR